MDLGPTVVALWIESLRATVPAVISVSLRRGLVGQGLVSVRTWFSKDSAQGLDVQGEPCEPVGFPGTPSIHERAGKPAPPLELLFWRTGTHDDVVELAVALEHQFP